MKTGHGIRKTVFWACCRDQWIALEGVAARLGDIPVVLHRPLYTGRDRSLLNGRGFVVSDPVTGARLINEICLTPDSALTAAAAVLERAGPNGLEQAREILARNAVRVSGPKPAEPPVAGLVIDAQV